MTATMAQEGQTSWLRRLGSSGTGESEPPRDHRRALTAAMNALRALAAREPAHAKRAAYLAAAADEHGTLAGLPGAVERAITEIETAGAVQDSTWNRLSGMFPAGPLATLLTSLRPA